MSDDAIIALVSLGLLFGGPVLAWITVSLASNWRQVRQAEQNAVLKREMIERGFSAEEIVRVIDAGGGQDDNSRQTPARRR